MQTELRSDSERVHAESQAERFQLEGSGRAGEEVAGWDVEPGLGEGL
jgi:hypothetical protein